MTHRAPRRPVRPFLFGRRAALAVLGGGALTALPAWAAEPPGRLRFAVFRKGAPIGEHEFRFTPTARGQRVDSRIDLAVKMAFVTVYRYAQEGRDEWRDGVLVRTDIATDDNGERTRVQAAAEGDRLRVSGPGGGYDLALGSMTDLNFWNPGITRQTSLIDSQNAELVRIAVTFEGTERLRTRGAVVDARRFVMGGTKGRSGTIWYDADGSLVKALVNTRGERLDYEPAP